MTVSYTGEVATTRGFGCFLKLLKRWRGSIYKLVWVDLLLFLTIYYTLNFSYLYIMDTTFKTYFRHLVLYCGKYGNMVPLSFILGFYVNIVFTRWWAQYSSIPFPDNLAISVGASMKEHDERSRIMRRTVVRYACLAFTWTLTLMSSKVKKRFPTFQHFVDCGLLSAEEKTLIEEIEEEFPNYSKYWLPLAWAASVTTRARHEGIIQDDMSMQGILNDINNFRSKCGSMLDYDWISIPLVYTQVVTLATYCYFFTTVIGNQFLKEGENTSDFYFSFPFMSIIEFFFYMGWLKVAEALINPFGEDDDDFEIMWMVDRHLQVCYLLVDRIHQSHPKLEKDMYWDQVAPLYLPFTVASQNFIYETHEWSTIKLDVKSSGQDLIVPDFYSEADGADGKVGSRLWRRAKTTNLRNRNEKQNIPLFTVSTSINEQKTNCNDAINVYEGENNLLTLTSTLNSETVEDFESLREKRLAHQRDKLLKIIQLLKSRKGDEEDILNSILQ